MRNGYIYISIFAVAKKAIIEGKRMTVIELADRDTVSQIKDQQEIYDNNYINEKSKV